MNKYKFLYAIRRNRKDKLVTHPMSPFFRFYYKFWKIRNKKWKAFVSISSKEVFKKFSVLTSSLNSHLFTLHPGSARRDKCRDRKGCGTYSIRVDFGVGDSRWRWKLFMQADGGSISHCQLSRWGRLVSVFYYSCGL